MMETDLVIVIGLGGLGSAALASLARRGVRVLGLETGNPPHDRGSSHGGSRVARTAYFEHPDYVPLARAAFAGWDRLEEETGRRCLHRCGVLLAGSEASPILEAAAGSARDHGISTRALDPDALQATFPDFKFPARFHGLLEPDAGFVVPETAIEAQLEVARRHGASVRTGVEVRSIEADGHGVEVVLDGETIKASRVVVTAGSWTGRLLPEVAGIAGLRPQRKIMVWCRPRAAFREACTAARMPAWLIDDDDRFGAGLYYGVPTSSDQVGPGGMKFGFHGPGTDVDPENFDRTPSPMEISKFARDVATYLPGVFEPPHAARTCLYTMSRDEHFVIDRVPDREAIVVAAGLSGHGFKFAPALGDLLASLAIDDDRPAGTRFLSLGRFESEV